VRLDSSDVKDEGMGWASQGHPIGRFGYRSHSYGEWDTFASSYAYTHGGEHPHRPKPNHPLTCQQMNNCSTLSGLWRAPVSAMWHRPPGEGVGGVTVVRLEVSPEPGAHGYAPPAGIFLTVSELPQAEGMLGIEVVWQNKAATRLYEGVYFDMRPQLHSQLPESANPIAAWRLMVDKIGTQVDASDVVVHGGSAVHGMDPNGGVTFVSPVPHRIPSFHVDSLDAGLVLPAAAGSVLNYTAFYDTPADPVAGVSFNLMNNLYWTNYVLWYPWRREDTLSRFRFRLSAR